MECGAAIDPIQGATTAAVCGRLPCVVAASARRADEQRAIEDDRRERGRALLEAAGQRPEERSWSTVPANRAPVAGLPSGAIEDFRRHLRRVVAEASARASRHEGGPTPGRPPPPSPTPPEADALARGCATCRGSCCRRGGNHAFLDAASIRRILANEEALDPIDLEARYESRVHATHLEGGCLFQGPQGCRLPRTLRSNTCNDWLCEDLTATLDRWREGGESPADHRFVPVSREPDSALESLIGDGPGDGEVLQ